MYWSPKKSNTVAQGIRTMVKGAAKNGSPGKKKKEAAAEKVAETAVVRSANLSRPPAVEIGRAHV